MTAFRLKDVPDDIRKTMTDEQLQYILTHSTNQYAYGSITARRRVEMLTESAEGVAHRARYFPLEASDILEQFKYLHYDQPPQTRDYAVSTVADRLETHYPNLPLSLRCRMLPLGDAGKHIHGLDKVDKLYREAEGRYLTLLACANAMTAGIEPKSKRKDERHRQYRLAFEQCYPTFRAAIDEACAIARTVRGW
jgi:hypothetical protein